MFMSPQRTASTLGMRWLKKQTGIPSRDGKVYPREGPRHQADGLSVETVESLGRIDALHPLQQAFWEKHGLQCGFCTPGMLMSVAELLRANPAPDREAISEAIGGNLCRCTGYQNIVAAVEYAVELLRTQKEAAE